MITLGDTFWKIIPGFEQSYHLYFLITAPTGADDELIVVNLTTKREGSDLSCVLHPGDHPRIRRESAIEYRRAEATTARQLEEYLRCFPDLCRLVERASPELIRRIQEGALKSPHLREDYKERIRKELGLGNS